MARDYVVRLMKIKCSMGTVENYINVDIDHGIFVGQNQQPLMNANDHTDKNIMLKLFEMVGYDEQEIKSRFGALYTAFQYGAPPHAGVAPGFERLLMLMLGITNIRDVVAFPLNSKAQDVLMGGPIEIGEQQLRELHIKLRT